MFNFKSLHHIQIEITNKCQASCPMCLRNIHGGIDNPLLRFNDWTIDEFKNIFNSEVLSQITAVNFCGDFGDPIMNNDLIAMCKYLKDNSNVSVEIHTNGSARSLDWWKELAESLPANHFVEFALDGLINTHELYRIGTDFNAIIRNAKQFITSGGTAHWMFIKFKHNEHEVELARELSVTMGFNLFTIKNSKRFGKKFPVLSRQGDITHYIEQPTNSNIKPVTLIDLKNYKNWKSSNIDCFALSSKELYIDAHGHLLPCCLIASFLYAYYDTELYARYNMLDDSSVNSIAKSVQQEIYNLIAEFGGLDSLDANKHGIKHIMEQPLWQSLMHTKWNDNASSVCKILCSSESPYISIDDQISHA